MKTAVIFTGGTIGSVKNADGIIHTSPDTTSVLNSCLQKHTAKHDFTFSSPITMLSETATAKKQNVIIKACRDAAKNNDAIIITHGTDTLGYTAALLDYALYDICIPVVLVSSGHVLTDPKSNGIRNLEDALAFIEVCKTGGVFVVWNGTVHRGARILPPVAYTDDVKSLLDMPFGIIADGRFELKEINYIRRNTFTPYPLADENRQILTVIPTPGMNYDSISDAHDAVLHLSYHSGTTDTESDSFKRFCRRMKDLNIPVFLHGSYANAFYETKKLYSELGIITLPIMSQSACYEKLLISDYENISKNLCNDIVYFSV